MVYWLNQSQYNANATFSLDAENDCGVVSCYAKFLAETCLSGSFGVHLITAQSTWLRYVYPGQNAHSGYFDLVEPTAGNEHGYTSLNLIGKQKRQYNQFAEETWLPGIAGLRNILFSYI